VPEIDLPGHVQAAVASYPELGATGERIGVRDHWGISEHVLGTGPQAFQFVEDVLNQVADVFPGPFVHIGGDECPVDQWRTSPEAQRHMLERGFVREREIQGEFSNRARGVLASRGKRMIGWDEILETDAPADTVAMVWRRDARLGDATGRGFQAVNASQDTFYLDYYQGSPKDEPLAIGGRTTLRDVYEAEVVPDDVPEDQRGLVLGVQGQLWTEYVPDEQALEYMAFPRICALAEVAWGTRTSYRDFTRRLQEHLPRLERLGIAYRPLD
jgi:hexosaminidase